MTSLLLAHDLGLSGSRGPVFEHVSLAAEPGQLICVEGSAGSGRTALLLALAGRGRFDRGTLALFGRRLRPGLRGLADRRTALRHTGLALIDPITSLDDPLTVAEHLGERAALLSRLGERVGRVDDAAVRRLWGEGDWGDPPPAGALGWELSQGQRALLEVQLARMGTPAILAVDNVHHLHDPLDRARLAALLEHERAAGTCVLVAAHSADDLPGPLPDRVVRPRPATRTGG